MFAKSLLLKLLLFSIICCWTVPAYSAIEVEEIIGGDIYLLNTGEEVRLAGVDTKAIRTPGRLGVEFSKEALSYIANLFKEADVEIVDSDRKPEKDERRQVYIYLIESKKKIDAQTYLTKTEKVKSFLNLEIIRRGYGKKTRRYKSQYKRAFEAAQKEAKENRVGMWRS
jgi:endonuclease YncB( thermonuclease family)